MFGNLQLELGILAPKIKRNQLKIIHRLMRVKTSNFTPEWKNEVIITNNSLYERIRPTKPGLTYLSPKKRVWLLSWDWTKKFSFKFSMQFTWNFQVLLMSYQRFVWSNVMQMGEKAISPMYRCTDWCNFNSVNWTANGSKITPYNFVRGKWKSQFRILWDGK